MTISFTTDDVDILRVFVDSCVHVLGLAGGASVLADQSKELRVATSTSASVRAVEMSQLTAAAGPSVDSVRRGEVVVVRNIENESDAWHDFRSAALQHDFSAVFAMPVRSDDSVIGAVSLFWLRPGAPTRRDLEVAQALSDVAAVSLERERSFRESQRLNEQLQHALESRVVIEQAKGVVSAVGGLTMDQAFSTLRRFARARGLQLREVAALVTARPRAEVITELMAPQQPPQQRGNGIDA